MRQETELTQSMNYIKEARKSKEMSKRTALLYYLVTTSTLLVAYLSFFSFVGAITTAIEASSMIIFLIFSWLNYFKEKHDLAALSLGLALWIAPAMGIYTTGGIHSQGLVWIAATPSMVAAILGRKGALLTGGISVFYVLALYSIHLFFPQLVIDEILDPSYEHFFLVMSMLSLLLWVTIYAYSSSLGFEKQLSIQKSYLKSLERSEAENRSILSTAPVSVILINDEGTILKVNSSVKKMLGYTREELLGKNVKHIVPSPDKENHDDYLKRYLKSGIPRLIGTGRKVTVSSKDNKLVDCYLSIGEYMLDGKKYFTGILSDISELVQREKELEYHKNNLENLVDEQTRDLKRSKELAEMANEAKSTFLANVSHEIRTPLHGVLSFAEIGMERVYEGDRDDLKDYFSEITETGNRLLLLLNDVLDLSKLQAGKMSYDFVEGNLMSVVNDSRSKMSKLAEKKGVEFEVYKDKNEDYFIEFDQARISQVMSNLLSNAIKFSQENCKVEIFLADSEGYLSVTVQNIGESIPEEELELIFDNFSQSSNNSTKHGGTGLGLAICRKIVKDHFGEIFAENNGEKVLFTFKLPKVLPNKKVA